MASDDEMALYSDEEDYYDNDDVDEEDYFDNEDDVYKSMSSEGKAYTILSARDIKMRQQEDINHVKALLPLTDDEACLLLNHYNWDFQAAEEAWFADENKVRGAVGLPEFEPVIPAEFVTCGICFDELKSTETASAACSHRYCKECWNSYISVAIDDGFACLSLRCPEPKCTAAVTRSMVKGMVDDGGYERYMNYLLRAYVEKHRNVKWCPFTDCEFSAEFVPGSDICDVRCRCFHSFCWKCAEDAHRPVDCETAGKWILKNSSEAENVEWILSYTKPCPKCKKPIEKNHGCNHMTCRDPCRYEFCWVCLGNWSDHVGQFYKCNRYQETKEDAIRKNAKESLQRYTHYYERWAGHNKSRLFALEELRNQDKDKLEELVRKVKLESIRDVEFIGEAWKQIVDCRQFLQWTYTYGFYHLDIANKCKKDYFEFAQGLAEWAIEQLQGFAQREGKILLDGYLPLKMISKGNGREISDTDLKNKFKEFQLQLVSLTSLAKKYFDGLVEALENGLDDIGFGLNKNCPITGTSSGTGEVEEWWLCRFCTYANEHPGTVCITCLRCKKCTFQNPNDGGICEMCDDDIVATELQ